MTNINTTKKLVTAWYQLINGNISDVNVYRVDVAQDEKGNYIVIRPESESERPIKSIKWTKPVVVVEIVTRHINSVTDEIAADIDNEISQLYAASGLPQQDDMQIIDVYRESTNFLTEYDGSEHLYRHISRYRHDIFHK